MADKWSLIIESYKKAKECLWENKPNVPYNINRENGKIYLYKAYHDAMKEKVKDHLWYARILFMMYEQNRGRYSEHLLFKHFLNEAYSEYMLAVESGNEKPEENEIKQIMLAYKKSKQYTELRRNDVKLREDLMGIIGGKIIHEEFRFKGSKVVSFFHDIENALLKLYCRDIAVTLKFTDIYEIKSDLTSNIMWVSDLMCCRHPEQGTILFDIGFYKILCAEIEAVEIENGRE